MTTTYASENPKEIYEFCKDAISCGAFNMARIFKARMYEMAHNAETDKEATSIYKMIADINEKFG